VGSTTVNEIASLSLTNTATARGVLKTSDITLAGVVGAKATLSVSGTVDLTLAANDSLTFGPQGQAILNIADGANVTSNGISDVYGPNVNLGAAVTISGAGSMLQVGNLTIGDPQLAHTFGQVTVSDHGLLNVTGSLDVYENTGGSASMNVTSNGTVQPGELVIGNTGSELGATPPSVTLTGGASMTTFAVEMNRDATLTLNSNSTLDASTGGLSLGIDPNFANSGVSLEILEPVMNSETSDDPKKRYTARLRMRSMYSSIPDCAATHKNRFGRAKNASQSS